MSEIRNLTRNGETFYPLTCSDAVLNRDGEPLGIVNDIFDVSEYNASGTPPVLTKYDTLSLALAAIPTSKQKGGMTVRYVQTSDNINTYVQYRLISDTFNTTITNWVGEVGKYGEIEIPRPLKGYRSLTGDLYGEFNSPCTSYYHKVGKGKVRLGFTRFANIPCLYVLKSDGTEDWYQTEQPNITSSDTGSGKKVEIVLPQNVVAIKVNLCADYATYIPDTDEDADKFYTPIISSFDFSENCVLNSFGEESYNTSYPSTKYIDIQDIDYIEVGGRYYNTTSSGFTYNNIEPICFYDKNYNFISSSGGSQNGLHWIYGFIKKPADACYVRFCAQNGNDKYTFALLKSASEVTYEKYKDDNKFEPLTYNIRGKNINVFGDSLSHGSNSTNIINNSYIGILRKMFRCEFGGKLNYGFCNFGYYSQSDPEDMLQLIGNDGWSPNNEDHYNLSGESYYTSTNGASFRFKIRKSCHYIKVASHFDTGLGTMKLKQGDSVIATISLGEESSRIGYSDLIDVSECDFSSNFEIVQQSGTVNFAGIQCIDNPDWWTFNNYSFKGKPASIYTSDLFTAQAKDASVIFYALGYNGTLATNKAAFDSIKTEFKNINAKKFIVDPYIFLPDDSRRYLHEMLRYFAGSVDAEFIPVYTHYPQSALNDGSPIAGFYTTDNIHPSDAGHQFIAELIAKNIGLSVNSKGAAEMFDSF